MGGAERRVGYRVQFVLIVVVAVEIVGEEVLPAAAAAFAVAVELVVVVTVKIAEEAVVEVAVTWWMQRRDLPHKILQTPSSAAATLEAEFGNRPEDPWVVVAPHKDQV